MEEPRNKNIKVIAYVNGAKYFFQFYLLCIFLISDFKTGEVDLFLLSDLTYTLLIKLSLHNFRNGLKNTQYCYAEWSPAPTVSLWNRQERKSRRDTVNL